MKMLLFAGYLLVLLFLSLFLLCILDSACFEKQDSFFEKQILLETVRAFIGWYMLFFIQAVALRCSFILSICIRLRRHF